MFINNQLKLKQQKHESHINRESSHEAHDAITLLEPILNIIALRQLSQYQLRGSNFLKMLKITYANGSPVNFQFVCS